MLAKMGLQGKVTFSSIMAEDEIRSEIRSAFVEAMGLMTDRFHLLFSKPQAVGLKH